MINSSMEFDAPGKSIVESRLGFIVNYFGNAYPIRWGAETDYGTLSIVEAQELIEVLQAIIADYPKEPTNEEILNELPNGSIIQFNEEKSRWFKSVQGWYNSKDGVRCTDTSVFNSDYDGDMSITVKYRGDE